jgi:N-acetylmuramoyl-L-alanine amidase
MINDINPDLCVSIHHNAAESVEARGAEVIHAHYDEYDDKIALSILNRLAKIGMPTRRAFTKLNSRGSDWYYMIREIWDKNTDAIIVEGGFVTNKVDAGLLSNYEFLRGEALAIGEAIIEYLNIETVVKPPHWGASEIKALIEKQLIKEDHNGEDLVTWAEFATVVNRIYDKLNK